MFAPSYRLTYECTRIRGDWRCARLPTGQKHTPPHRQTGKFPKHVSNKIFPTLSSRLVSFVVEFRCRKVARTFVWCGNDGGLQVVQSVHRLTLDDARTKRCIIKLLSLSAQHSLCVLAARASKFTLRAAPSVPAPSLSVACRIDGANIAMKFHATIRQTHTHANSSPFLRPFPHRHIQS